MGKPDSLVNLIVEDDKCNNRKKTGEDESKPVDVEPDIVRMLPKVWELEAESSPLFKGIPISNIDTVGYYFCLKESWNIYWEADSNDDDEVFENTVVNILGQTNSSVGKRLTYSWIPFHGNAAGEVDGAAEEDVVEGKDELGE